MNAMADRIRNLGRNWKGDLYGGITSAVVALPLALAFGVLSGAGPQAGLYSAMIGGTLAAIFGGSPAQITGPTAGMTVVLVPVYKALGLQGLFLAMFLAGLIQMAFSLLRVGKYIHFIPQPVISGFTNGIAVLIFTQQVASLRGPGGELNGLAVAVALGVMAVTFLWPRLTKAVPGSLVALVGSTLLVALFTPGQVPVIGEIPAGLPRLDLGFLSAWQSLPQVLWPAVMVALLGIIESLLASVVVDEMAQTKHHSDREIFGQGLANTVTTLFGGIVGTGAIVRSAVNVKAGGRTPLSGVIHGILILLVTVSLSKYAGMIPTATLCGILMSTAIGMVDKQSLRDLPKSPVGDAVVLLTTVGLTVFVDLITGVATGTLLAALLFAGRMSRAPLDVARTDHQVVITLSGPLFFGTAKRLLDEVEAAEPGASLVLDLGGVTAVDATGAGAIRKVNQRAQERGIQVVCTGLQAPVERVLQRFGALGAPAMEGAS